MLDGTRLQPLMRLGLRTTTVVAVRSLINRGFWYASRRYKSSLEPASASSSVSRAQDETASTTSPLTQTKGSDLAPLASVLSHPLLVVTREIEWGNLLIGFEQANKYAIRVADGRIVGFIAEESSLGRAILRQALRTHRSFQATIMDALGTPVLRVHRPAYLVSSSISVYRMSGDAPGPLLGEAHMNWHLWRRRYDLFDAQGRQFGEIDAPMLAIEFPVRGETSSSLGNPPILASIDKDWTGLGRELFTDARQYVVRMDPSVTPQGVLADAQRKLGLPDAAGVSASSSTTESAQTVIPSRLETPAEAMQREQQRQAQLESKTGDERGSIATAAPREHLTATIPDADVPLNELDLSKRAVILATAISIDFDYFSLHSGSPGMFHMPFFFPLPIPGFGGASKAENETPPPDAADTPRGSAPNQDAPGFGAATGDETPPWMRQNAHESGAGAGANPASSASAKSDANPWATFEPGVDDPSQQSDFDEDVDGGYDEGTWGSSSEDDSAGGFIESLWGVFSDGDDGDDD
ncbi:hypothetical protein CCYA_CCYA08G2294 [Cyanidiococcus yangmingshanensis]|nr:hypothetical protein CCYA_CCYA08G2294 [Cyanidiococcus yangmingshanensis]